MQTGYGVTLFLNGKPQGLAGDTIFENESEALNYLVNLALTSQQDFLSEGYAKVEFKVDMVKKCIKLKTFNSNVRYELTNVFIVEKCC